MNLKKTGLPEKTKAVNLTEIIKRTVITGAEKIIKGAGVSLASGMVAYILVGVTGCQELRNRVDRHEGITSKVIKDVDYQIKTSFKFGAELGGAGYILALTGAGAVKGYDLLRERYSKK